MPLKFNPITSQLDLVGASELPDQTGESGKYLTTDGSTASWGAGGGDVLKVGTPIDSQVGVWTGDGTIEGTANLTYDGSNLQLTGDIGSTGTKITKGWFTDLAVTNAIAGSVTGNAGTVTNATLTTALTVNTGTLTLTANVANTSVLTIGAGVVSVSGANTGDQSASGFNHDDLANITGTAAQYNHPTDANMTVLGNTSGSNTGDNTVATALTGTPSITVATVTTTGNIELGHASDTTIARVSAGLVSIEGSNILTATTGAAIGQTMYIGTTATTINRASAAQTLAGLTLTTPDIGTPSAGVLTNCTFPTLNQNTTGSAATLTTPRAINGVNFDGSAAITVTADANTLSNTILKSTVVTSSLTSVGTLTSLAVGAITSTGLLGVTVASGYAATFMGGNVGIGTTTPVSKLHVNIPTKTGGLQTGLTIALSDSSLPLAIADVVAIDIAKIYTGTNYPLGRIASSNNAENNYGDGWLSFSTRRSGTITEAMRITSNGNVGIGTTGPGKKLAVANAAGSASEDLIQILNNRNTVGDSAGILFSDSFRNRARIRAINENTGNARGSLAFETGFSTDTVERVRINSDGNVGIGTTAPGGLLEVGNSATGAVLMNLTNIGGAAGDYAELNIRNDSSAQSGLRLITLGTAFTTSGAFTQDAGLVDADLNLSGGLNLAARHASGVMRFYTGGSAAGNERVRIDSNGNVGIGTTSPGKTLEVVYDSGGALSQLAFFDGGGSAADETEVLIGATDTSNYEAAIVGYHLVAGTDTRNYGYLTLSGASKALAWDGNGNVGIGTASPRGKLEVVSGTANTNADIPGSAGGFTGATPSGQSSIVSIDSNSNQAANTGGVLGFGGRYITGGTGYANWASIKGLKTNATSTNYSGYLAFYTRLSGAGSVERMRIDNTGNVGIGVTDPDTKLEVFGSTGLKISFDATDNTTLVTDTNGDFTITPSGDEVILSSGTSLKLNATTLTEQNLIDLLALLA